MVCPAQAGMIRMVAHSGAFAASLPRTSGDDPAHPTNPSSQRKFAPHKRG